MALRKKKQRVLLVGLEYSGAPIRGVSIQTKGLFRPKISPECAADSLYDYDVIIINPASYSHFIFGRAGQHSESDEELWDLKKENNDHDLDAAFDRWERQSELTAALEHGTRVVFVMAIEKKIHFFGSRSLYQAYLIAGVEALATSTKFVSKKSKKLMIERASHQFASYFKQLEKDAWTVCGSFPEGKEYNVLASTPDRKVLGVEIEIEGKPGWMVTPPSSMAALRNLITCAIESYSDGEQPCYQGIFLSHTHQDKEFVNRLKSELNARGVEEVWVDETEMMVGDPLQKKIEDAITKTRFFGVVLSPRSVKSRWVQKELELAMQMEMENDSVVVLPLLLEKCEIPPFLRPKVYADFTSAETYEDSLEKLLRRLALTNT
jgi:hypothetical protein